ncbi:hypothetical protein G8V07_14315 [Clostridium botulinum D/C]|nr:hypothetical protein [Clostridium botulinum]MCD3321636.1 hypothetical protein [Clostridium botulinum D/C]MCD3324899.1 hypothetical protein [Clostridium botulinum D/C]MCD3328162.1 hypothetical protein [Clostridium botulinum D/C]
MKEVNCLKCGMQLGEIDKLSVIFKKGVRPMQPTSSMDGVIFIPFECPKCKKIQMEVISVNK